MKKKVKLTLEQVKKLQEYKDKKIKISESQFNRLKEHFNISNSEEVITEGIAMELIEFAQHLLTTLKDILTDPSSSGLDPIWGKLGINRGQLLSLLMDFGIISYSGYKFIVITKNLSNKVKRLYHKIMDDTPIEPNATPKVPKDSFKESEIFLGDDMEIDEDSNYPEGANFDSRAPWRDNSDKTSPKSIEGNYSVIYINNEYSILTDNAGNFYYFYYYLIDKKDFAQYSEVPRHYLGKDENGEPSFDYEDFEITSEAIESYINDNINNISKGEGIDAYEAGDELVLIDQELAYQLIEDSKHDQNLINILKSLLKSPKGYVGEIRITKGMILKEDLNFTKLMDKKGRIRKLLKKDAEYKPAETEKKCANCRFFNSKKKTCDVIRGLVDENMVCNYYDAKPSTNETTVAGASADGGSSGPYVTPMAWAKDKKNWRFGQKAMYPSGQIVQTESKTIKLTKEQFKLLKENFDKTQWPKGEFVEFDDCVYYNNNKEAQNGGCSQGAVDNVLKTSTTKDSVISKKGIYNEALDLQLDKNKNMLYVYSTLEGRAANQETFTNKNVLKQNGFRWNGNNWEIPADKLDVAKKTLSLINKVEYVINDLSELKEYLDGAKIDNKNLIKSKIDQYITDLANATDERALSAEIKNYLSFFAKFHQYSFFNRFLIYIQRPNATRVASYTKWKEMHRQVIQGAKGITIFRPMKSKTTSLPSVGDEEGDETDDKLQPIEIVTAFVPATVFDVSDTKAIDERGEIPETPNWWGGNEASQTADILSGVLLEVSMDLGISVSSTLKGDTEAGDGESGYSSGGHIAISSNVKGATRVSTMVHELAHELMHWKKSSPFYQEKAVPSALAELQAESVAYTVLTHYGIEAKHQATYLALWKANKDSILASMKLISDVSQFIIDKIEAVIKEGNISLNKNVGESVVTELDFSTVKSAAEKMYTAPNRQDKRANDLIKSGLNAFIGLPLLNTEIEDIKFGNRTQPGSKPLGNDNEYSIYLKKDIGDVGYRLKIIIYDELEDSFSVNTVLTRRDAVILSKFAKIINPTTKYTPQSFEILEYRGK